MPDKFDTSHAPFDRLTDAQANTLSDALDVAYYRRGDTLLAAGGESDKLFIIIKGSVEETSPDGKESFTHYTTDDLFDVRAVLKGRVKFQYRALEDTLCYLLPADVFLALCQDNKAFSQYFDANLQRRQALLEQAQSQQNLAEFILTRIDDSNIQPALEVPPDTSIKSITHSMREKKVDCALVKYPSGDHKYGIITRTNLLHALVMDGYEQNAAVGDIATSPVVSVEKGDFLFNAMIAMTRDRVKRVQVLENSETAGMLDLPQVLSLFSTHSHVLNLQIARATSIDELSLAANGQSKLVSNLINNGIHTRFVMKLISTVNEQIINKAFQLTVPEAYQDKCCLIVMGSEGRGEQVLKTDQDNALILDNGLKWPECDEVMADFSQTLNQLGYPPCPGKVMVNNPRWVKSQSQWLEAIDTMTRSANSSSLMDLAILADSHAVAGNKSLLSPVQDRLLARLSNNMLTLNTFVRPALAFRVPLTLFGSLKSDKEGLDIKKGGIFPIIHGVRTMALERHIGETNTFDRLERLRECNALEPDTVDNLSEALKLFIKLRLRQQLASGAPAGNALNVGDLPPTERDLLRHGLNVVKKFKEWLAFHYQVRD